MIIRMRDEGVSHANKRDTMRAIYTRMRDPACISHTTS